MKFGPRFVEISSKAVKMALLCQGIARFIAMQHLRCESTSLLYVATTIDRAMSALYVAPLQHRKDVQDPLNADGDHTHESRLLADQYGAVNVAYA